MSIAWTRKDLLSIADLSPEEILLILDTAAEFKKVSERKVKKVPALRGKTVVNLFIEPSTRTRASFELAEQRLSADIINMSASTSSLTKGETLLDTAKNIEALQVDLIVMRHSAAGSPLFLAKRLESGVINAGDGAHAHPTQALLDLFTIRTHVFQNLLREVIQEPAYPLDTGLPSLGKYLDKTSVFLGKYLGTNLFLELLLQFQAVSPLQQQVREFGAVKIDSELLLEWKTPFFLLEWSFFPKTWKDLFIPDNKFAFSWKLSY